MKLIKSSKLNQAKNGVKQIIKLNSNLNIICNLQRLNRMLKKREPGKDSSENQYKNKIKINQ
jgi:hypothetical protein